MHEEYIFLFIVSIVLLYVSIKSIDLKKAIIAIISFQSLPIYFELLPRRLPFEYKQFLIRNDKFYRDLSPKLQRSYGSRIMKFIDTKEFITRDGLKLTTEMLLLISSAAVKITFGLRDYRLSLFHTIIIYSDEFYSKVSQAQVKGETNAGGVIVFSWKDLKFGASIPNDSLNLGYHEFAHALFLENLMNPYNNNFKKHYREWLVYITNNDKLKEVQKKHIFRDYAAVNKAEFFAVSLENFFEKPDNFKKELPRLYEYMTEILNQDLAKI